MASPSSAAVLKKGDIVWVLSGNQHEEPATVLETGCHRPIILDDDDDDDDNASDQDDDEERQALAKDGILVRFHVSNSKAVFAPDKIRPFETTVTTDGADATSSSSTSATAHRRVPPPRRSTRGCSSRSVVTPSPNAEKFIPATTTTTTTTTAVTTDAEDDDSPSKDMDEKKPPAKRKAVTAKNEEEQQQEEKSEDEKDESVTKPSSPYFAKNKRRPVAAAATRKKEAIVSGSSSKQKKMASNNVNVNDDNDDNDSVMLCLPVGCPLPAAAAAAAAAAASSNESSGGEEDEEEDAEDDEEEDLPYIVEYSPTGRATCRRCDEVIAKDSVRISHQPMFRGKPGFRVYRHLNCALFDEKIIASAQDIGGWRNLSKADYQALQDRVDASRLEMQQEEQELQPDELVPTVFTGEMRQAPPGFVGNLLPFQVEGLSWMRHQEVHVPEIKGGILADEMGMGKTIQTIATILDNRTLLQHSKVGAKHDPSSPDLEVRKSEETMWQTSVDEWKNEMKMLNVPPKMWPKQTIATARAGTLVVCPVIALNQWKTEIEKFTNEKTLTVAIYHGPNRTKELPPEKMRLYDVILTTYQVLEQDFRKMVSPNKVTCPNCKNKFKADKLRVHLKYFCGAGAERTEAQARQRRAGENRRRGNNGGGGGGGNCKKDGKKSMSKKSSPMTKAAPAKKPAASTKKTVRARSTADYDSDSELTAIESGEDEPVVATSGRPSRSAAKLAIAKVSASIAEWGDEKHPRRGKAAASKKKKQQDDDDSSFASDSDDDEDSDNDPSVDDDDDDDSTSGDDDDDEPMESLAKITPAARKKSPSSNDNAVARAREKQRQALENAKKRKMTKSKAEPMSKKAKNEKSKPTKKSKGQGKKKFDDDSSSDDGSDDDDGKPMKADPMDDIDLEKLMKEAMAGACFSVLHSFSWWRLILDEAHMIKSRSSQTAAAAFSLTGIHRWCLSGTPLQNRVGELYSLIRFLRIDPMAHYFCKTKGCTCKNLHYRIKNGTCQDCGHRGFSHFAHFNKHVLNVIQREGYSGDGRRAMFTLKNEVLDKCLLRRTKETRAEDMNLPPRIVTIRTVRLHPIEEDFYNALYSQTRSNFDDYVAEGTLLNNYAHIFDLLTKLRQAVGHPYCVVFSKTNSKRRLEQQQSSPSANVANGSVDCDICHEPFTERVITSCCGTGFCRSCVIEYLAGTGGASTPCPSCNNPLSIDLNQASTDSDTAVDDETLTISGSPSNGGGISSSGGGTCAAMPSLKELPHVPTGSILRRINLADFTTSTKIEVLVQELIEMRQQRPGCKALVFSQFVNMLDLVRWRLHSDPYLAEMGLGVRILHGGMDVKSRDATLQDFREDKDVRILLMSLKAGGVALNLTVASEVYLLDNWWNPAAEMQAIDRTHRLGQHRPIRAVRFIAEGTVEERVLQLQEKKRMVFDGTVGRDAGSLKALSVTDMKALFT